MFMIMSMIVLVIMAVAMVMVVLVAVSIDMIQALFLLPVHSDGDMGARNAAFDGLLPGYPDARQAQIVDLLQESLRIQPVKEDILAVYDLIAQAESHAHGVPVTDIHFHEVGRSPRWWALR